jgi:hypothetical protein
MLKKRLRKVNAKKKEEEDEEDGEGGMSQKP